MPARHTTQGGMRSRRNMPGRKSGAKKKANPKNMKKTTSKGAYKPERKAQMSIRRAPIVETLKYQRSFRRG